MIAYFANSYSRFRGFMSQHPELDNRSVSFFVRGIQDVLGVSITTIVFLTPIDHLPPQVIEALMRCTRGLEELPDAIYQLY